MVRAIPFGKLQKIWAVIRGDAIFLLLEVSLADVDIFYSDSLSRNLAFNRFMFMPEISNRMVFVNGKHPRALPTQFQTTWSLNRQHTNAKQNENPESMKLSEPEPDKLTAESVENSYATHDGKK